MPSISLNIGSSCDSSLLVSSSPPRQLESREGLFVLLLLIITTTRTSGSKYSGNLRHVALTNYPSTCSSLCRYQSFDNGKVDPAIGQLEPAADIDQPNHVCVFHFLCTPYI